MVSLRGVVYKSFDRIANKSQFTKNVLVLSSGSVLAQGLIVISAPIITRLYSPDDFGVLAVYLSIISICSLVTSLKYEIGIPIVDEEFVTSLVFLCFLILFVMTLLFLFIVLGFGHSGASIINASSFTPYLWCIPLGLLIVGSYKILNYWAIREKYFLDVTKTKVSQSIGRIITQISIGFINPVAMGLIMGEIIGQGAGIIFLWKKLRKKNNFLKSVSLTSLKIVAYRLKKFPLILTWSGLFNSSGSQLPPICLAFLYGTNVAGWYSLGQLVISAPLALVGQAVAQVYLVEASGLVREEQYEKLKALFCDTTKQLLKVGALPIILLAIVGPLFFSIIFGDPWKEAGLYIRLTSIAIIIQFISGPLFQTLTILNKQEYQFICDLLGFTMLVIITITSSKFTWNPYITITLYAMSTALTYFLLWILSYFSIRRIS